MHWLFAGLLALLVLWTALVAGRWLACFVALWLLWVALVAWDDAWRGTWWWAVVVVTIWMPELVLWLPVLDSVVLLTGREAGLPASV